MAGPLSTEEIEDLVSSVRRLVSNEQSLRRLSRDLNAERLLLTPSLRVVSETSPLAPLILEAPVEDAAASAMPAPSMPEPDLGDDDAVELIEADWEDELWTAPEAVSLGEVALGADEAEVLLPPADAVEALVAETDLPEPWAEVSEDWVEAEPIPFVPMRHRGEGRAADPVAPAEPEPASVAVPPLEAVAELALPAEDHEDDTGIALDPAADEADTQRMPTEILDADGTPLAVLDEAALQEIVRQMIREELQGDLGERITRNVRKLVRAEINRALVARDLD